MKLERIAVIGASKVGRTLARGWRAAGLDVSLRAARGGPPPAPLEADLVVLAVRESFIRPLAEALADAAVLGRRRRKVAVVHTAGALGCEVIASLRGRRVAIGQMHPLLSFVDAAHPPPLAGGSAHLSGDSYAVRQAAAAVRVLGMIPSIIEGLDLQLYHGAAALLAGGSVALSATAARLLVAAGAEPARAAELLGPLLASVAHNLTAVGSPAALSGPVRRGDLGTLKAHLGKLRQHAPEQLALYREVVRAQLPLARELGDASAEALGEIESWLRVEAR